MFTGVKTRCSIALYQRRVSNEAFFASIWSDYNYLTPVRIYWALWFTAGGDKTLVSPGLKLQRPLFARHLEGVRVVVVARFQDLHAVDPNSGPDRVLGSAQAEFRHAV